jgi:hypothetical protein
MFVYLPGDIKRLKGVKDTGKARKVAKFSPK